MSQPQLVERFFNVEDCVAGSVISRRGLIVDGLCALLVIPIWTYYGAIVAIASALVLGLVLRLVARVGALKPRRPL
jgi:hypothetical protein